jgi:hypothetical protein
MSAWRKKGITLSPPTMTPYSRIQFRYLSTSVYAIGKQAAAGQSGKASDWVLPGVLVDIQTTPPPRLF